MLTAAFFGSDSILSLRTLDAIASQHRVVAVVQGVAPRPLAGLRRALRRLRGKGPLADTAGRLGLRVLEARDRAMPAVENRLRELKPDLFCFAAFRWVVPARLLSLPALGAVNLHPSLLPRHRGPWPLFWTYFQDDRETGITLHRAVAETDAGPVLARAAFALPRGQPVAETYARCADLGSGLVGPVLADLAAGRASEIPQDEAAASVAPRIQPGTPMVPFHEWDVERVWHLLAGVASHYQEPLQDERGRPVPYSRIGGFERTGHGRVPGTVTRLAQGWTLYASGGVLHLA